MESEKTGRRHNIIGYFNRITGILDDLVLASVALGTIGLGIIQLIDLTFDFVGKEEHTFPHYLSEFMFVLIIVELFRQVVRLINKEPFSLNPFIFIGVIASVRGMIVMQMKMAIGEAQIESGVWAILSHGIIIMVLFVCYYLYTKINNSVSQKKDN